MGQREEQFAEEQARSRIAAAGARLVAIRAADRQIADREMTHEEAVGAVTEAFQQTGLPLPTPPMLEMFVAELTLRTRFIHD